MIHKDELINLIHLWRQAAEDTQSAFDARDYDALQDALQNGENSFQQLKNIPSEMIEENEEIAEALDGALRKWENVTANLDQWKEEIGEELNSVTGSARKGHKIQQSYSHPGKRKGKNVRWISGE